MKKRYLCIGLLLCTVTLMGCKAKDKEIIISNDKSQELVLQEKGADESIELGNSYLNQGKYDNAKSAYENAISKDPNNKKNYLRIKDKYFEKSRFDDAFYIIQQAINKNVDTENMKNILEEIKKNFQVITLEDTVYQNGTFTLPKKVTLQINGQQQNADVSWSDSNVDTSKVGSFTYKGTIEQYGRTVNQKVSVIQNKAVDNKPAVASGEIYKNDKLGFSIKFPESWKGKYTIKESDDGIRVYFKPSKKALDGLGFLFGVIKKSDNLDESHFDTVSRKIRYFKAKGITYVVGGPTDVNFSENHPEFNVFINMSREAAQVVETLKSE
jgi:tetratricopeptide (TPR) repeat protein